LLGEVPEQARARIEQQIDRATDEQIIQLYDRLLQLRAGILMRSADSHFSRAGRLLSSADAFERSMTLTVMRRHRGRFELFTGARIAIGIARGHDVDVLGSEIEVDGAPVELAAEREAELEDQSDALMRTGYEVLGRLEARRSLQHARDEMLIQ
jgi:hypothetical protein